MSTSHEKVHQYFQYFLLIKAAVSIKSSRGMPSLGENNFVMTFKMYTKVESGFTLPNVASGGGDKRKYGEGS